MTSVTIRENFVKGGGKMVYRYDGSFDGFWSCVFMSFRNRETPEQVLAPDELPLASGVWVETRKDWAGRVRKGIRARFGEEVWDYLRDGFLSCLPGRAGILLRMVQRLYRSGEKALADCRDPDAAALRKAVLMLREEGHKLEGFLRFSGCGGVLAAVIRPKNGVLPMLAAHFSVRFPGERFLIYDEGRKLAFFHAPGQRQFLPIDGLTLPPPDEAERLCRALWKGFLQAVSIRERENPGCQRAHLPLRFRPWMTEFIEEEGRPALGDGEK